MSNEQYKAAGVDVEAGYEAVRLMKQHVERTMNPTVMKCMANFGGLVELKDGNVLVAGTDGVGTKLRIAFNMDKHDTVGIDCVAMCVNDVVCHGAKPLFFLDYIATGKVEPKKIADIVGGVAEGCVQSGCALIGGETAEMPGFYGNDEYDMAGFAVGIIPKDKIIDGSAVKEGDALIGLASSGVHSNGFSLVRKLFDVDHLDRTYEELGGATIGETLLVPTKIYVKTALELVKKFDIHGIAHITGGGFHENIPRILPANLRARIKLGSWPVLPIFELICKVQNCSVEDMLYTFNMGIGMVIALPREQADAAMAEAEAMGEKAYLLGSVVAGNKDVEIVK
jgi:phosphoribosylformylglycinamidine cyclo-ligase